MLPGLVDELVDDACLVFGEHLQLHLEEDVVASEQAMLVKDHRVARRKVSKRSVYLILTVPLLHDDSVENAAIQRLIQIVLVKIPEEIVPVVVRIVEQPRRLLRIDLRVKHNDDLVRKLVHHDLAGVR